MYHRSLTIRYNFQELVEATMASCQVRLMLYGVCKHGYAARAASSIDVENFHGVLNMQHHSGAQTATIHQIQRSMSHLIMLQQIKKQPVFSKLFESPSEIYPVSYTASDLSEQLNLPNCRFDQIKGSNRNREVCTGI